MSKPATNVFPTTQQADSLTHDDALEREITDLCAQINAAGGLRFTRPDGRVIDEHPRLPACGSPGGLRASFMRAGKQPPNASDWIVPEGVLNLDLAISGLIQVEERKACNLERPS